MKAISDVIAMLLMLVITIGLVGVAYTFITGIFAGRTAIVLSIDPETTSCIGATVFVGVRNEGTQEARNVDVSLFNPAGSQVGGTQTITLIAPNSLNTTTITRPSGQPAGRYRIEVSVRGTGYRKIDYVTCATAT